jgi:nicotinamidase-related amidase
MFESNPDLAVSLRTQGIEHLVVVGLQTDYCVRASILGAITSGFEASKITLLRGAHSTYDNTSTGKSYQQVKEDVEKQLTGHGVTLQNWMEFAF